MDSGVGFLVGLNVEQNSDGLGLESLKSWGGPFVTYLLALVIGVELLVFVGFAHAVKVVFIFLQVSDS